MSTVDLFMAPQVIAEAKERSAAAVRRTSDLRDDAKAIADRSTAVTEANHLTELLTALMLGE